MTERIEPVLTLAEWRRARRHATAEYDGRWSMMDRDPRRCIALANAMLPDDDPRKISREWIHALRRAAEHAMERPKDEHPEYAESEETMALEKRRIDAIADALESYLPPV